MKDEKKVLKDEELKQVSGGGFDPSDEQILSLAGINPKDQHLIGMTNPGKDPKEAQRSENVSGFIG